MMVSVVARGIECSVRVGEVATGRYYVAGCLLRPICRYESLRNATQTASIHTKVFQNEIRVVQVIIMEGVSVDHESYEFVDRTYKSRLVVFGIGFSVKRPHFLSVAGKDSPIRVFHMWRETRGF